MSDGFLSRWSRKKSLQAQIDRKEQSVQARAESGDQEADSSERPLQSRERGLRSSLSNVSPIQDDHGPASLDPLAPGGEPSIKEALPTLIEAEQVPLGGDVSRFMRADVPDAIRSVALRRLFGAPEYNVRSTMDVYWEDFSNLPKLTEAEVRGLVQSDSLSLFKDPPWKAWEDSSTGAEESGPLEQESSEILDQPTRICDPTTRGDSASASAPTSVIDNPAVADDPAVAYTASPGHSRAPTDPVLNTTPTTPAETVRPTTSHKSAQ